MSATRRASPVIPLDAAEEAANLGLRYVSDCSPGIHRKRNGKGFRYVAADGRIIKDDRDLKRIRSLVIPPAWRNVWICARENGHLQATGRDAKGRKQYRYHPLYRQVRNQTKFARLPAFASVLPLIRRRLREGVDSPGLSRTKVLATVVSLLESTCIRVGNEEYVEQNSSYGLTTLRNNHVKVGGEVIRFRFKGKSGQEHDIRISDRKLARIVRQCQSLPGQELFQYLSENGEPTGITSDDVNEYLRETCGHDFTAKDFRTWEGTAEAVIALEQLGPTESATQAKKNIVEAVRMVSRKLGNRPATCKAYYIHPAILESYETGTFFGIIQKSRIREAGLRREECLALALIDAAGKQSRKRNKRAA